MSNLPYSERAVPRRSVIQLKRIAYTLALLLGGTSMIVELWLGSPTQDMVPILVTFDRIVFPSFLAAVPILYWYSRRRERNLWHIERIFSIVYSLFFLTKFGLTLISLPSVTTLSFAESWYWMLIGVWLLSFLAFEYNVALMHSIVVYGTTFAFHGMSIALKSPPGTLWEHIPDMIASYLRLGTTMALVILLGRIKHQWVVAEEEASVFRDMAHLDSLTQLPNRRHLNKALARFVKSSDPFAIVLFDLDDFKEINDRFGHAAGDRVLAHVGRAAQSSIDQGDIAGRWGGEEFLVLCPRRDLADAIGLAERLRKSITATALELNIPRELSASFGVATRRPGETPEQLVHRADKAMYEAKMRGKNVVLSADD